MLKIKNKFLKLFLIVSSLIFFATIISIVVFILCMYQIANATQLEGSLGGPQDAFRHTYSSAIVSRYIGIWAVDITTNIMERDPKNKWDIMDIHNNRLGAKMGQQTGDLKQMVLEAIKQGKVNNENPDQISWLPKKNWTKGF